MSTVIPDTSDDDCSHASVECYMPLSQEICSTQTSVQVHDGASDNESSVRRDREHDGRCADCGVQTHEFQFDPIIREKAKVPLSIPGEVHRGRCLFCHPIVPNQLLAQITPRERRQSLGLFIGCFGQSQPSPCQPMALDHTMPYSIDWSTVEALRNIASESAEAVDILSAMRRGFQDEIVQVRGCEKLWVLSWDDETAAAIGRVGGIPIVLEAMVRFPNNAHLQQCACETLQNLAADEYNSAVICDLGGVRVVVDVMARHFHIAGIQQSCCNALANLASSPVHRDHIIQAGGGLAVISAAQRFADEESVLGGAYEALRALGCEPHKRQTC